MPSATQPDPDIASVAALAADPTRARILLELMSGKALTAGELSRAAGITPQTCSGHLAKLCAAGFLHMLPQGRHRYYTLAGPDVADFVEGLQVVATRSGRTVVTGPADRQLRHARVCYDHLAGELGVALLDRLRNEGWVTPEGAAIGLTDQGRSGLAEWGIHVQPHSRRPECKECLDWSERRMHLAGAVGAAFLSASLQNGWLRRQKGSRAVIVTDEGRRQLRGLLGT